MENSKQVETIGQIATQAFKKATDSNKTVNGVLIGAGVAAAVVTGAIVYRILNSKKVKVKVGPVEAEFEDN
jgi:hypothetical protein